jgi:hypothetical protein
MIAIMISARILAVAGLSLLAGLGCAASTPARPQSAVHRGTSMNHAIGTFEVKLAPQAPEDANDPALARMTLDKKFHGDLEGTSKGQMLSAGTAVQGSAGYVAIERVTGTLHGRSGSFVLQHNATMDRGKPSLNIIVVPDSGTGDLAGLTGRMSINIADGKHSYEFEYTLAEGSR